jgi:hypothetical protein
VTKLPRPDLAALYLCALVVVAMTALAVAHVAIPNVMPYLALASLSAGAGISLNTPNPAETIRTSSSAPVRSSAPIAAAAPAPRAPVGAVNGAPVQS